MEFDPKAMTVTPWPGGRLLQELDANFFYGGGGVLPGNRIAMAKRQTQVYDPRGSSEPDGGFQRGPDVSNYQWNQAVVQGKVQSHI